MGYASMIRLLADEQLAGRLAIQPQRVISAIDVLTDETRERVRIASGNFPMPGSTATIAVSVV